MTVTQEDFEHIRFERPAAHVVQITLDRPDAANALSVALFAELDHALDLIESDDDVRVWMITGAPRSDGRPWFSAGADLRAPLADITGSSVDPAAVIDRIDHLLKPSIAVIEGFCTTGALELAMACDLRLAAHSSRLSDWHLKATGLGIGAWGSAVRLSRLVGLDKAKELLLTGDEVSGEEAEHIGLVNRAVPDDELATYALEMAVTIASYPPAGVRTTLGFLALQSDMAKADALAWAARTPSFMGLQLRPLADAMSRFARRERSVD